jgi:hypothetical protein
MENPLFSDVHKQAFNIAIHDIKQRHDWDINNLILINKDNYEPNCSEIPTSSTTKNDLAVDAVSRADVLKLMQDNWHTHNGDWAMQESMDDIRALPSVTPQEPRWIPVSERLPEEHICDDGYHEPSKSVLVQMKSGEMHTARYWSRYDERWLDLNYPTTDEVIAWMPLPKAYSEVTE